jgi:hypothetical protein
VLRISEFTTEGTESAEQHGRNRSKLQRLKPTSKKIGYGRAEARPSEGAQKFAHGAKILAASKTETE